MKWKESKVPRLMKENIFLSPTISHLILAFSLEELEGLMDLGHQASFVLEIQNIPSKD
jgi:hypothetical protein